MAVRVRDERHVVAAHSWILVARSYCLTDRLGMIKLGLRDRSLIAQRRSPLCLEQILHRTHRSYSNYGNYTLSPRCSVHCPRLVTYTVLFSSMESLGVLPSVCLSPNRHAVVEGREAGVEMTMGLRTQ